MINTSEKIFHSRGAARVPARALAHAETDCRVVFSARAPRGSPAPHRHASGSAHGLSLALKSHETCAQASLAFTHFRARGARGVARIMALTDPASDLTRGRAARVLSVGRSGSTGLGSALCHCVNLCDAQSPGGQCAAPTPVRPGRACASSHGIFVIVYVCLLVFSARPTRYNRTKYYSTLHYVVKP